MVDIAEQGMSIPIVADTRHFDSALSKIGINLNSVTNKTAKTSMSTNRLNHSLKNVGYSSAKLDKVTTSLGRMNMGIKQNISILGRMRMGVDKLGASFAKFGFAAEGAIMSLRVAAAPLRTTSRSIDNVINSLNKVSLVAGRGSRLQKDMESLYRISDKTRASIEGSSDIYNRFGRAIEKISSKELLNITEAVNKAIAISGAPAESARAAIIQLGQGVAAGQLRGQELNSVLEQTPRLAMAIADHMGIAVGQLRRFAEQGKVTSEVIRDAMESQRETLDKEFKLLNATISTRMVVMVDAFERFLGTLSDMVGVTKLFIGVIDGLTRIFQSLYEALPALNQGFATLSNAMKAIEKRIKDTDLFKSIYEKIMVFTNRLKRVPKLINNIFVKPIMNYFKKLYVDLVGGSIWPDTIDGIVEYTKNLSKRVPDIIDKFVTKVKKMFSDLKHLSKTAFHIGKDLVDIYVINPDSLKSRLSKSVIEAYARLQFRRFRRVLVEEYIKPSSDMLETAFVAVSRSLKKLFTFDSIITGKEFLVNIIKNIKNVKFNKLLFKDTWVSLRASFEDQLEHMRRSYKKFINYINGFVVDIETKDIETAFILIARSLAVTVSNIIAGVPAFFNSGFAVNATVFMSKILEPLTDVEFVKKVFKTFGTVAQTYLRWIAGNIRTVIKTTIDYAGMIVEGLLGNWNSLATTILGVVKVIPLLQIPVAWFAINLALGRFVAIGLGIQKIFKLLTKKKSIFNQVFTLKGSGVVAALGTIILLVSTLFGNITGVTGALGIGGLITVALFGKGAIMSPGFWVSLTDNALKMISKISLAAAGMFPFMGAFGRFAGRQQQKTSRVYDPYWGRYSTQQNAAGQKSQVGSPLSGLAKWILPVTGVTIALEALTSVLESTTGIGFSMGSIQGIIGIVLSTLAFDFFARKIGGSWGLKGVQGTASGAAQAVFGGGSAGISGAALGAVGGARGSGGILKMMSTFFTSKVGIITAVAAGALALFFGTGASAATLDNDSYSSKVEQPFVDQVIGAITPELTTSWDSLISGLTDLYKNFTVKTLAILAVVGGVLLRFNRITSFFQKSGAVGGIGIPIIDSGLKKAMDKFGGGLSKIGSHLRKFTGFLIRTLVRTIFGKIFLVLLAFQGIVYFFKSELYANILKNLSGPFKEFIQDNILAGKHYRNILNELSQSYKEFKKNFSERLNVDLIATVEESSDRIKKDDEVLSTLASVRNRVLDLDLSKYKRSDVDIIKSLSGDLTREIQVGDREIKRQGFLSDSQAKAIRDQTDILNKTINNLNKDVTSALVTFKVDQLADQLRTLESPKIDKGFLDLVMNYQGRISGIDMVNLETAMSVMPGIVDNSNKALGEFEKQIRGSSLLLKKGERFTTDFGREPIIPAQLQNELSKAFDNQKQAQDFYQKLSTSSLFGRGQGIVDFLNTGNIEGGHDDQLRNRISNLLEEIRSSAALVPAASELKRIASSLIQWVDNQNQLMIGEAPGQSFQEAISQVTRTGMMSEMMFQDYFARELQEGFNLQNELTSNIKDATEKLKSVAIKVEETVRDQRAQANRMGSYRLGNYPLVGQFEADGETQKSEKRIFEAGGYLKSLLGLGFNINESELAKILQRNVSDDELDFLEARAKELSSTWVEILNKAGPGTILDDKDLTLQAFDPNKHAIGGWGPGQSVVLDVLRQQSNELYSGKSPSKSIIDHIVQDLKNAGLHGFNMLDMSQILDMQKYKTEFQRLGAEMAGAITQGAQYVMNMSRNFIRFESLEAERNMATRIEAKLKALGIKVGLEINETTLNSELEKLDKQLNDPKLFTRTLRLYPDTHGRQFLEGAVGRQLTSDELQNISKGEMGSILTRFNTLNETIVSGAFPQSVIDDLKFSLRVLIESAIKEINDINLSMTNEGYLIRRRAEVVASDAEMSMTMTSLAQGLSDFSGITVSVSDIMTKGAGKLDKLGDAFLKLTALSSMITQLSNTALANVDAETAASRTQQLDSAVKESNQLIKFIKSIFGDGDKTSWDSILTQLNKTGYGYDREGLMRMDPKMFSKMLPVLQKMETAEKAINESQQNQHGLRQKNLAILDKSKEKLQGNTFSAWCSAEKYFVLHWH